MFRISRFLGIFGIVCACMFSANFRAHATNNTVFPTYNCNHGGGSGGTYEPNGVATTRMRCHETVNGFSDGDFFSLTWCESYTLPTAAEAGCTPPPPTSDGDTYELAGWRAGNSLWMFKPGDKIAAAGEAFLYVGGTRPVYNAVWTKVNKTFEVVVDIPASSRSFEIKIAAKGKYRIYWGDGKHTDVEKTCSSCHSQTSYPHTYQQPGTYSIGLVVLEDMRKGKRVFSRVSPVLEFKSSDRTKITKISGSLGAVFNSSWERMYTQTSAHSNKLYHNTPSYANLFNGATNLTGPIPEDLFVGSPSHKLPSSSIAQLLFTIGTVLAIAGIIITMGTASWAAGSFLADLSNILVINTTIATGTVPATTVPFQVSLYAALMIVGQSANVTAIVDGAMHDKRESNAEVDPVPVDVLPKYFNTFMDCSNLTGSIPPYLFGNKSDVGNAVNLVKGSWGAFDGTFYGCSSLTGEIPATLFGNDGSPGVYLPRNRAFAKTFEGCSGLTGSIPDGLFALASGYSNGMFVNTFKGCSGLSGPIPADLFAHTGSGQVAASETFKAGSMFQSTFEGCNNLTSFIPPNLFGTKAGRWAGRDASYFMTNIFKGATKLCTACDSSCNGLTGYKDFETGFRNQYWSNGVGTQKVVSCEPSGDSGGSVQTITLDVNGGTFPQAGINKIYQKYNSGWAVISNPPSWGASQSIGVGVPTYNNYLFLGYFAEPRLDPISPVGKLNKGYVTPGVLKIRSGGGLVPMNPKLTSDQTWYAVWVMPCEDFIYEHGHCTTTIATNGSYQYWLSCDEGYHFENQSCVSDLQVYTFTLDSNDGTGGTPGPLYEAYNNGWALSQSPSSWSNPTISKPSLSGYRFVGYFAGDEMDEEDYLLEESDILEEAFVNNNGLVVADASYAFDGTLYAIYARECNTETATQNHATCQLTVGYDPSDPDSNGPRDITVKYETSCNTGYEPKSGVDTYQPKCKAIEYPIYLEPNGATLGGAASLWAMYNDEIQSPSDDTMGSLSEGPRLMAMNVPRRIYNISYDANDNGDATMPTLTDSNTKGTWPFNGYYDSATGNQQYIGSDGYLTQLGLDVGTHYLPQNGQVTWYAQWSTGSVTLPLATRPGYTLKGWYTKASGGTKRGNGGATYNPTQTEKLYAQWTPIVYEFQFDDDNSGDANALPGLVHNQDTVKLRYGGGWFVTTTLRSSTEEETVTEMDQLPTRAGYVFDGYNLTRSDGTTIQAVSKGGVFTTNYNIIPMGPEPYTLTAQWSPVYAITLDPNGGTGGATTLYQAYQVGFSLNQAGPFTNPGVIPTSSVPSRTGYDFNGYWTTADGGSVTTEYVAGTGWQTTVDPNYNSNGTVWYAHWTPKDFKVTLNDNCGNDTCTSGLAGVANQNCTFAGVHYANSWFNKCLPNSSGGTYEGRGEDQGRGLIDSGGSGATLTLYQQPQRSGYVFMGYYTTPNAAQNGGGIQVVDMDGNFLNTTDATTYFTNNVGQIYANWIAEADLNTHKITLNPNGGTPTENQYIYELQGGAWYADAARQHQITASIFETTANGGADISTVSQSGYVFNGYWTVAAQTGGDQIIDSDGNIMAAPNVFSNAHTIYARWINPNTTVTLNPNGGTACATTSVNATYNSAMPSGVCQPTRTGYDFQGYYQNADGSGTQYYNSGMVSAHVWDQIATTATIYAKWATSNYTASYKCSADAAASLTDTIAYDSNYTVRKFSGTDSVGCTTPAGKIFTGWAVSGTNPVVVYDADTTFQWQYTENKTFTAQFADSFQITFSQNGATVTPDPAVVYLKPGTGGGWFEDRVQTISITEMRTPPERPYFTFNGYWTTASGEGVQIVGSDGVFKNNTAALNAYAADGIAYARWTAQQPDFIVTTTSITANQTFAFSIRAKGTFIVDWGDGTAPEVIERTNTNRKAIWHTYSDANANGYQIGISGQATQYSATGSLSGFHYEGDDEYIVTTGASGDYGSQVTISFNLATDATSDASDANVVATPLLVGGISGSLGSIFPTLGTGVSSFQVPKFMGTFEGCSNMTGSIPGNLFDGVRLLPGYSGTTGHSMFAATFKGCSGLEGNIPSGLFSGIETPAEAMFAETFSGCSGLNGSIPSGLFSNVVGNAKNLFVGTFKNCSGLSGSIPAGLFSSITGNAQGMFAGVFYGCSGLSGSIPATLFNTVSGAAERMFSGTFWGCSGLQNEIPSGLFSHASGSAVALFKNTFYGCSGLNGSIPAGMFNTITGSANEMFNGTFRGCSGLSGSVPAGLFSNVSGAGEKMFARTFQGCTDLSSYIPPTLFANAINNNYDATQFMNNVFDNSGLLTQCPGGMSKYEPDPWADYWYPKVSCEPGPAYVIALDANGGTVTSGTTTEVIYEKYGVGFGLNMNGSDNDFYPAPTSTLLLPIVPPTRSGYDFLGYFDDPENGSMIINENGSVIVPSTHFDTYATVSPDVTLYAHWHQGVDWVFTATTTELPANRTVKFNISAAGKFYVDCGDNGVLSGSGVDGMLIDRTGNTSTGITYTCTYSSAGSHQIKFGRRVGEGATGYGNSPAISFYMIDVGGETCDLASISGSLGALFPTIGNGGDGNQPKFYQTFKQCSNLTGSIPRTLFSGLSGAPSTSMFHYTFSGTGLTGAIPSNLFANVTGVSLYMFNNTFSYSPGLTSIEQGGIFNNVVGTSSDLHKQLFAYTFRGTGITSVPANLFSNVASVGEAMFSSTFADCANLTSVPATLFSNITTPVKYLFNETFSGSGLQSVPANLFSGITSAGTADGLFKQTFKGCASLTSVPATLFNRITGAPSKDMFNGTFANSGLMTLPIGLFTGLSGAPAVGMFQDTFNGCVDMVGQLSSTMFAGIVGAPASRMFSGTFGECSGLTGSIPAGLFSGINGPQKSNAFEYTFGGCSGLTGYVPPALFVQSKLTGNVSSFMSEIFMGASSMDTVCPAGTAQYITGFEDYWGNDDENENSKVVSCSPTYQIILNDGDGTGGAGTIYWMPGVGYSLTGNAPFGWITLDPLPSLFGYWFSGYYTETGGNGTQVFDDAGVDNVEPNVPASGNTLTLYAGWSPKIVTVTLNDMNATTPSSPNPVYLRYDDNFYGNANATGNPLTGITIPEKTGYAFGGYYTNQNATGSPVINSAGQFTQYGLTFTADSTATVYAKWTAKVFNINYNYNGGYEVTAPYVPVEYISTNGSSYFDSGINISRSNEIRARFAPTSISGALYGTASSGTVTNVVKAIIGNNYGNGSWTFGNSRNGNSYYVNIPIPAGVHQSIANYAGIKLDGVDYPLATFGADFTTSQTLAIGSNKTASNTFTSGFRGQIYSFEIDNGVNVLFNGVSVCNNLTGTCGLLDVSDPQNLTFHESANTAFSAGAMSLPQTYSSAVVTSITGIPTRAHSDFVGWCTNSGLTENCALTQTLPIGTEGNKEYWAKWTCRTGYSENSGHTACVADSYTISFNANGGDDGGQFPDKSTLYWTALPVISTTAPTKTGYTFMGWYDNADYSNGVQYYTASGTAARPVWDKTQSATLYAAWTPTVYTITLNNGTTAMNITGGYSKIYEKYDTGWSLTNFGTTIQDISDNPPVRSGYTLRGYYQTTARPADMTASGNTYASNLKISAWTSTTPATIDLGLPSATTFTSNKTLYAAWAKNCPNLGNTGTCQLTVSHNGAVSYVTSCAIGYVESGHNTANVACTAGAYTLTYTCDDGDGGEGQAPATVGIEYGDDFIFEDNVSCHKVGHSFAGWRIAIESPQPATPYQPGDEISSWTYTSDSDIVAVYTPNDYTLHYDCGTGATGTIADQTVTFGDSVNVASTAACSKTGHVADGWNVSGSADHWASGATIDSWNYAGDKTFTVKWDPAVYQIDLIHPDADIQVGLPNPLYLQYDIGYYSNQNLTPSSAIGNLTQIPQRTGHEFTGYYRNLFNKNTMLQTISAYIPDAATTWTASNSAYSIRIPCEANKTYLIDFGSDDTSVTGKIRGLGYVTTESKPTSGNPVTLYNGIKTSTAALAQRYYTLETGAGARYIIVQFGTATPGLNTSFWNNFAVTDVSDTPIIYGEYYNGVYYGGSVDSLTFTTEDTTLVAKWTPIVYNIAYDWNIAGIPEGSEYTPVEYIENTGGSYINTGVSGYGTWDIDVQGVTAPVGKNAVLVAYYSNASAWFGAAPNNKWGFGSNSGTYFSDSFTNRVNVNLEFASKRATATINGVTINRTSTNTYTLNNYQLMDYNSSYPMVAKLYSAKFYNASGQLVFNGIPVRHGNECGLYDTVSGTFKSSANTTYPFSCPSTSGLPNTYTYGVGATVNGTLTRPHATFNGWCPVVNGVPQTNNCAATQTISTTATGDKEYWAKWTCDAGYTNSNNSCNPNIITLHYNNDYEEDADMPDDDTCVYGGTFDLPDEVGDTPGYWFSGWVPGNGIEYAAGTTHLSCTSAILGVTSGTAIIEAEYANGQYEITLDGNGATTQTINKLYTIYDTGVYRNSARTEQMGTDANPITPIPQKIPSVTYSLGGGALPNGSSNPESVTSTFDGYKHGYTSVIGSNGYITSTGIGSGKNYTDNTAVWTAAWVDGTVTLPLPTRNGYTFTGWYQNVNNTPVFAGDADDTYTVTASVTLDANWAQCGHTAGDHSSVTYTGTNASNQCVYTVTCDTGYSQNGGTNTTTSFTASGDAGVGAGTLPGCQARSYGITYDYNGGIDLNRIGYTPVEYIRSSLRNLAYIDTRVYLSRDDEIRVQFKDTGLSHDYYLFGVGDGASTGNAISLSRDAYVHGYLGDARDAWKWGTASRSLDLDLWSKHAIVMNKSGVTLDGVENPFGAQPMRDFTLQDTLAIGALHDGSGNYTGIFNGNIYSFQVVNATGVWRFNGIPIYDEGNNTCGLYDTVSGGFLVSGSNNGFDCPHVSSLPSTYTYGIGADITGQPTREHATFGGWCSVINGNVQNDCALTRTVSQTETGPKSFQAKWTCDLGYYDDHGTCEPYAVPIRYGSDYGTPPDADRLSYNSTLRLPRALSAQGYYFVKWQSLDTGKSFNAEEVVLFNEENFGAATAAAESRAVTILAVWSTNSYNCDPGYYLPAGATTCATCTAGNYCLGGGWEYDARQDQGLSPCPTGYGNGGTGLSAQNQCAMSLQENEYVAVANDATATACATGYNSPAGLLVYYGNTSACDANVITLTFGNGGHGGTAPTEPATCTYNQSVTMPAAMSADGYTFNKWVVSGTNYEYNAGATTTCDVSHLGSSSGSVTINATWTTDSYNINYEFNGGFDPRNVSGYTPVDYIASDGVNYIDLGFKAAIQRDWAEITFKRLENVNTALFGNYNDDATGYNFMLLSGKTSGTGTNKPHTRNSANSAAALATNLNMTDWYTLSLDNRNGLLRNYSPSENKTYNVLGDYNTAHNMVLFADNNNGTIANWSKIQLRGFTLYEGTDVYGPNYSLKLRGIPMRHNSDDECGLLDVSDTSNPVFYTSAVAENPLTCPNTVSYPSTYTYGTATTIASAPTREHSRFVGWCTDAELTQCGDADSLTISATDIGNKTLYAKWACNPGFVKSGNSCVAGQWTITLSSPDATTPGTPALYITNQVGIYRDSARTELMTISEDGGANPITKPIRQYTVTYNPNGGTVSSSTATATYTFRGYYNDTSGGTRYIYPTTGTILGAGVTYARKYAGDATWYAHWAEPALTLPTPSRPGYVFDGWYDSVVGGNPVTLNSNGKFVPTADTTLYAHWTQCGHTPGAHSSVTATTNASNQCVYNITCDTGYSQLGGSDGTTSFNFTADTGVVTGTLDGCSIRTFNVSYACDVTNVLDASFMDNSTYGTVTVNGVTIERAKILPTENGKTYTLSATTTANGGIYYYYMNEINPDGTVVSAANSQCPYMWKNGSGSTTGSVDRTCTFTTRNNATYVVYFANSTSVTNLTLTNYTMIEQLPAGTVLATGTAPNDDTVTYGTQPTLPSTAGTCTKSGHTLVGWRPSGESTNWENGSTWTYLNNKIFIAQWSANEYTITYDFQGGFDPRVMMGYTPIEYLESTKSGSDAGADQYINIPYYGNPETRAFVDYQLTALPGSSNSSFIFGDWKSNGGMCFAAGALYGGSRWLECSFNNSSSTANVHSSTVAVDLNRHQLALSSPRHLEYWTDVPFGTLDTSNLSLGTTTNPFTVFTTYAQRGTASNRARMKLFGFQLSEAGDAEFTGIPVRRGNECGLLDITDTTAPIFYGSATSTQFSCPATTGLPASYTYGVGARVGVVPVRANARFMGWCPVVNNEIQTNNCSLTQDISTTDTGNKVFAASWECDTGYTNSNNVCVPKTITVNYVVTPATSVPAGAVTSCVYDQSLALPGAPSAPGYAFGGWGTGGNTFGESQVISCNAANLGVDAITAGTATVTAQWTFDPKFTITTTSMTADDTFRFYISAAGTFVVDWGDGTVDTYVNDKATPMTCEHTYTTAGVHNIRVGGRATGYSTLDGIINNDNITNPAIFFYNSGSSNGTPTKIASVTGSMGAVFPTLGSTNGRQPRFYRTFEGATNLTSVSSTLFNGVTGSATKMFGATFRNCSNLTTIPSGLFSGISGSAQYMFYDTFNGCSTITQIPSGLFDGVSGAAESLFAATFQGCSEITAIPSGLFDGVTGSAINMFSHTFYNCTKLVTIPTTGLFRNVTGGASQMFLYTFANCPQITSIPTGLFNGVTTPAENIFAGTFMNDVALTTIPSGLFANVTGGAAGAFWATFYGCSGLTGPIPANMFQNITVAAQNEFAGTFYGATHLSGYVPPMLFDGLNGANATSMMEYIFGETNLAEECPCGTHQYITGYESDWDNKVACEIGLKPNEHWYGNQCVTDCDANVPGGNATISKLKTSSGLEFPILSTKPTTVALNFGMANNSVCYAPLETGNGGNGSMDISYNNSVYHVGNVSSTAPVGWDPMAELVAAGVQP